MSGMKRRSRPQGGKRRGKLLWPILGLAVVGTAVAVISLKREPALEDEPADDRDRGERLPPPTPPDNLSIWIPGPSGNLFVRDGGLEAGDGLPILFLHSLAGNGGQWALQLDHLRRHRRALALDLRGHGDSDPADDNDYRIENLADDVAAAADQSGLRRFVLAGHSLGALVAIEYAGRHPERVAGLLLVDPNGDQSGLPREEIDPTLAAVREDPLGEITDHFRQLVLGGDPDAGRWVLDDLLLTAEDAIVGALESAASYAPLPALARYPGPKLAIISSLNSLPISLHKLLPDLPVRLLPGTGHWLMMDRPETFNRLVDDFLVEIEGEAGSRVPAVG